MHKQQATLISAGGTPGHLATLCRTLADAGVVINAIGGAEWRGSGAVAIMCTVDTGDFREVVDVLRNAQDDEHFGIYHSGELHTVSISLPNQAGTLATALEALAAENINVGGIMSFPVNGGDTLVSIGVSTEAEVATAETALANAHVTVITAEALAETLGLDPGDG